eukprot:gene32662-18669_t
MGAHHRRLVEDVRGGRGRPIPPVADAVVPSGHPRSPEPCGPRAADAVVPTPAAEALPPRLQGCSVGCCGVSVAVVRRRWLVIRWGSNRSIIELPVYMLFCGLWLAAFLFGWLAFSHSHPNPFLPGHVCFDLFFLVALGYTFGNALSKAVHLPPLFGYLVTGMLYRNIPGDPTSGIPEHLATVAKEVALCIIVCRAGLGLPVLQFLGDPAQHRRNANPPDAPTFSDARVGMVVRLVPPPTGADGGERGAASAVGGWEGVVRRVGDDVVV